MTTGEVQKLGGFAGSALSEPLLQVGTILFVLGYMFWVQPLVATVALALYVPQLIIVPLAQRRMNRLTELIALSTRQLGEVINKDEAGTATKDDPARRFTDLTERILWIRKRFVLTKNLMKLTNNFLIALGPFGVTVYGGYLVIAGETEIGVILAFVSGLERLSGPFRSVIGLYSEINFARTRYAMLLDAMPAHERGAADGRAPA